MQRLQLFNGPSQNPTLFGRCVCRCCATACRLMRWRCCRRTAHSSPGMVRPVQLMHHVILSLLGRVGGFGSDQPTAACARIKLQPLCPHPTRCAGRWALPTLQCMPSATSSSRRQRTRRLRARRPAAQPLCSTLSEMAAALCRAEQWLHCCNSVPLLIRGAAHSFWWQPRLLHNQGCRQESAGRHCRPPLRRLESRHDCGGRHWPHRCRSAVYRYLTKPMALAYCSSGPEQD